MILSTSSPPPDLVYARPARFRFSVHHDPSGETSLQADDKSSASPDHSALWRDLMTTSALTKMAPEIDHGAADHDETDSAIRPVPRFAIDFRRSAKAKVDKARLSISSAERALRTSMRKISHHRAPLSPGCDEKDQTIAAEIPSVETKKVLWVDMKVDANSMAHHTNLFDICRRTHKPELIVRRGQSFSLSVALDEPLVAGTDSLHLLFEAEFDGAPAECRGSRVLLAAEPGSDFAGWTVEDVTVAGGVYSINVFTDSSAVIGCWQVTLVTRASLNAGHTVQSKSSPVPLYLLFNPWCKDDACYMPSEAERTEYIVNDVGTLWRGSRQTPRQCPWSYAQFDDGILQATLMALNRSQLKLPLRGDPTQVVRAVAQLMQNPAKTLLEVNMSEVYAAGIAPMQFTGSSSILKEYMNSDGKPVKYGQSWVFSAVTCTMLRCLGIGCRTVTGYDTAHQPDMPGLVNVHFDLTTGQLVSKKNTDSVWNSYVWVECYVQRSGEPTTAYDGWQALDVTPAERSAIAETGPASVAAITSGQLSMAYDTHVLVHQTNALKAYWLVDQFDSARVCLTDADQVGALVVTQGKVPAEGGLPLLDVTAAYKQQECSLATVVCNHSQVMSLCLGAKQANRRSLSPASVDPVQFSLDVSKAVVGGEVRGALNLVNLSRQAQEVNVSINLHTCAISGQPIKLIKNYNQILQMEPSEPSQIALGLSVEEYCSVLSEQNCFLVSVLARVLQDGQVWTHTSTFTLQTPPIKVQLSESARVGTCSKARASVTNPLPVQLTNCSFMLEGPGLIESTLINCGDLAASQTLSAPFVICPWKSGERTLIVRFHSDQLGDVGSHLQVKVLPKTALN